MICCYLERCISVELLVVYLRMNVVQSGLDIIRRNTAHVGLGV